MVNGDVPEVLQCPYLDPSCTKVYGTHTFYEGGGGGGGREG